MELPIRVLKFGGSSVADGDSIRRVAAIIARHVHEPEGAFPVVVVSAMAGVTDQLLRIACAIGAGRDEESERELRALEQRHLEAATQVAQRGEDWRTLRADIVAALSGLRRDVAAMPAVAARGREAALRMAAVAVWGERLSTLLLAAAVRDLGVAAERIHAEVIVTDDPPDGTPMPPGAVVSAEPLHEATRIRARKYICPLVERRVVPVVAGFVGRTAAGLVTTLGRNGSDYSAAVLGAALDAVEVVIYSDVDGVLTADPHVVADARLLPRLSYREAAGLAWFGARVLHPRTFVPLAVRSIPIWVRNTFRPQGRGTVIGPEGAQRSGVKALALRRCLALVTVERAEPLGGVEDAVPVFAAVAALEVAPLAICASSGQQCTFVIDEHAGHHVMRDFAYHSEGWRIQCRSGLAACAGIGAGFTSDPRSLAQASVALAREGISVVAQGSTDLGIIVLVEDQDGERAIRCLHRHVIAPAISPVRDEVTAWAMETCPRS